MLNEFGVHLGDNLIISLSLLFKISLVLFDLSLLFLGQFLGDFSSFFDVLGLISLFEDLLGGLLHSFIVSEDLVGDLSLSIFFLLQSYFDSRNLGERLLNSDNSLLSLLDLLVFLFDSHLDFLDNVSVLLGSNLLGELLDGLLGLLNLLRHLNDLFFFRLSDGFYFSYSTGLAGLCDLFLDVDDLLLEASVLLIF